ncbi:class I SAM-dependent methyltransferase [Streptomyces millisiae]|uniref:Class I SAM-dependent methyltransferase n=1 Tax=Streptomyces millisiae TaxID=3075542 RepID=A0ABU2LHB0_9ACTN|nr:class I SAM-dependent methyltransferase [Streptomyces sp. DSM 44918]MDT0316952.1 class I SAM-dependent methyltransferase [Streptomyces sp. DSM 44918]
MYTTTDYDWDDAYRTGEYEQRWDFGTCSPDLVGLLAALGPGHGRAALDLGCGSGWDALALARAGYDTTGVDISPEAIAIASERAAKRGSTARFLVADVRQPDTLTARFDLLTDRGCFHHLGSEDRDRYAAQTARLLRAGGLLFIRGAAVAARACKPVSEEALHQHFHADFEIGPVQCFTLDAHDSTPHSHACALTRKP